MRITLRDYQTEALCVLLEHAKRQANLTETDNFSRRLLCIQPTGAGKTILILAFAAEVRRRFGWKTLLVVPSRELVSQTTIRARKFLPELRVTQVSGGAFDVSGDLVVATSASLAGEKLKKIPKDYFSLVVCDEAHHAAARSFKEMLDYFSLARLQVGVTATHIRGDGESVASPDYFGTVVVWNTISQLTRAGFLVPAYGYRVFTETNLQNLKTRKGEFCERELSKRVNNEARNLLAVESYLEHLKSRPTVCFAVDVAHAQDLARAFNVRGIHAEAVWGAMNRGDYANAMRRFARNETQVLVNAKLLVEGWDSPKTSGVLIARPATSASAAVLGPQMIGRALRPNPETGKTDAVIVELRDAEKNGDGARSNSISKSLLETIAEADTGEFSSNVPLHEQADFSRAVTSWREREKLRRMLTSEQAVAEAFDVAEEIAAASRYSWIPLGTILHMPLAGGEFLEIIQATASCWEVSGCFAGDFHIIGTALNRADALAIADAWLCSHASLRKLILRDEIWRTRTATDKQILRAVELTGLSATFLSNLSSGQISDLIRSAYALALSPEELVFARSSLSAAQVSRSNKPHSWQVVG